MKWNETVVRVLKSQINDHAGHIQKHVSGFAEADYRVNKYVLVTIQHKQVNIKMLSFWSTLIPSLQSLFSTSV